MVKSPLVEPALKLLLVIRESTGPVGTRVARRELLDQGLDLSESTISRQLRDLDELGLTVSVGTKGRVLTPAGEAYAADVATAGEWQELLRATTAVKTTHDVLNLLKARRAVEPEAAREAAGTATEEDVARLRSLIRRHAAKVPNKSMAPWQAALEFHRTVASLAMNPLLKVMLGVVLSKSFEPVEAALDVIMESHGDHTRDVDDHSAVVDAIAEGNSELAAKLMQDHLEQVTLRVSSFSNNGGDAILARLLTVMA
ncbi:FCD domain-containing protein [Arthrobacter sp. AB6]|uniref:FadR/GntR family transcriptional regulator n=1 Tax=Arthrobacter sp. AB6 TaxID=2962570 RepID=UPI002882B0CA|nr:FCD domain-containing protein [Arthrobacter sp. AB6]MDT0196523.1 FCD domain-containing protein [Arthrobacter sp. AB6]